MTNNTPKSRRKKAKPSELSLREIKFATAVFEGRTAAESYRAAGFPQRPAESTWTLAARVLRKPAVQAFIHELRDQACDAARINANRVAQGIGRCAFADPRKLYDARGQIKLPRDWPDELALAIDSVESEDRFETQTETDPDTGKAVKRKVLVGYVRKVKLSKRGEALRLLAQWRRLIQDSVEAEFEAELTRLREMLNQYKASQS